MRRVFSKFDKDGNGTLDKKELQNATAMLGDKFSMEDVEILMSIIDKVSVLHKLLDEFSNSLWLLWGIENSKFSEKQIWWAT